MNWWDGANWEDDQKGYAGLALIAGTGLSTSLFALSHASRTAFGPGEAAYVFTPVVVSVALVVAGTLLWTYHFEGAEMWRIGCWVFVGMTVFGLLVTWTITHELVRGDSFAHAPFVTVNSMSIGALSGLALGWLDARNHQSERQLAYERNRLKQQIEELDEFAGIVSHDLRNPLNVATLRLQSASVNCACDETRDELEEIETALDRMERIVEDVLTMAREGQPVEETAPVSLTDVANHCWRNVETEDATLEVVDSMTFYADRSALEHIFENLFRNAVEHGHSESETINPSHRRSDSNTATQVTGHVVVEDGGKRDTLSVRVGALNDGFYVEDDGAGLPEIAEGQLFDSGVTTHKQGTGFGLSIVEKLVNAHGWEVRATDSDGGGARFEISGVERTSAPVEETWLAELD